MNGVDVRAVTQRSLRESIGVVPQSASLFNDTIRSNILYGRRGATQEDLDRAVSDAQLSGFIDELPDGWDSMVGDRGLKLSGGEKQRTAIARCLLKDPQFVGTYPMPRTPFGGCCVNNLARDAGPVFAFGSYFFNRQRH